jgi:3-hydroxyisobutyrate dehydrogenase-like beta-hydroxyacid dehydrogenase
MLEAGFQVVVYDAYPEATGRAVELGAEAAASPEALAREASVILLSLPGPAQLEAVLFGESGLIHALSDRHIVIDTSTVDPQTTRRNAARVKEKGAEYLDSPILGRPSATGKWMLPTGGCQEALDRAKPILLTFAANALRVGDSGAGNALKLLNQMMFSCINAISSEVMAICDHVGIDREVFYQTVAGSSAATVSGLFREVGKNIVRDEYRTPAFTVDLLIKDTKLALEMARASDAPSVITGTVQMYNEIAHAMGLGDQDTSALYKVFSGHYRKADEEVTV